jgi:hypothetical protein
MPIDCTPPTISKEYARHLSAGQQQTASLAATDTLAFLYTFRPKVLHPLKGLTPFRPYPYQIELLDSLDHYSRNIILKARQIGISTTTVLQKLRRCLSGPVTCMFLSAKEKYGKELIRIARTAATTCDPAFPYDITTDNQLELGFSNGSRIIIEAASQNPARSYAVSDLLLDEFAFWPWQDEMFTAIRPTVSRGGSIAIMSTPDSEGDLFHKLWQQSQEPGTSWRSFNMPWWVCPEYGDAWAAEEQKDYTHAQWLQEYECSFLASGAVVFSPAIIAAATELARSLGLTQLTGRPIVGRTYKGGADLSGEGDDETVWTMLDVSEQPWQLTDALATPGGKPDLQAYQLDEVANRYNADLWVDNTGLGWAIASLMTSPYTHRANITSGNVANRVEENGTPLAAGKFVYNIPRVKLIVNLVKCLELGKIAIPPSQTELIFQLKNFRWTVERPDDWVFSLALAAWAASNAEVVTRNSGGSATKGKQVRRKY